MTKTSVNTTARPGFSIAGLCLILALGGCMSPEQERMANLDEDSGTCSSMGARYGSPAHTDCMLQQQQRRDHQSLIFLEQARIHSEMARNAQEMRDDRRRDKRD
jgi:hypothetical protein